MALNSFGLQGIPGSESTVPLLPPRPSAPGLKNHPLAAWLPALNGVQAKLDTGARVADLGCGSGKNAIALAQAFPRALLFGYDLDEPAIERARRAAQAAGVINRTYFLTVSAADFPGWDYDVLLCFQGLLGLANPAAAARRVRSSLTPDGSWVIVEKTGTESQLRAVLEAAGFTRINRVKDASAVVLDVRL